MDTTTVSHPYTIKIIKIISYFNNWWERCSCLMDDVLDTIISSVFHSHILVIDTPNNVCIAICHLPPSLTICSSPPTVPLCRNWSKLYSHIRMMWKDIYSHLSGQMFLGTPNRTIKNWSQVDSITIYWLFKPIQINFPP